MRYIAGSASGLYEANPSFALATRAEQFLDNACGGIAKIGRGPPQT